MSTQPSTSSLRRASGLFSSELKATVVVVVVGVSSVVITVFDVAVVLLLLLVMVTLFFFSTKPSPSCFQRALCSFPSELKVVRDDAVVVVVVVMAL